MTQTTIYSRVFTPFLIAVMLATIAAWWIATSLLTQALEQRLTNQLTHSLETLASGTFPLTADLLMQLAELQDMDFALLNQDGTTQVSTLSRSTKNDRAIIQQSIIEAWQANPSNTSKFPDLEVRIKRLSDPRSVQFAAIAGIASKAHVNNATTNIAITLAGVSGITIVLLAWWGHRTSTSLTIPMNQLTTMAAAVATGDHRPKQITTSIREVGHLSTALNDMAVRLDELNREVAMRHRMQGLGELAARVAHEIRNPLTAIKLQIQLLVEENDKPPDPQIGQHLLNEVNRLEMVVNSALSLGRPLDTTLKEHDLNQVVREVSTLVEPQFRHRKIEVHQALSTIPNLFIDADRIKQVIFNLYNNAADALPGGGILRVSTAPAANDKSVTLSVEDSGSGIPKDVLPSLFNHPQNSSKTHGLGVGLTICKEITELHNGTISVEPSVKLGGARFKITLPVEGPLASDTVIR